MRLGVNIEHVATLRQASKGCDPSPIDAAFCLARAGADSITVHVRKDNRPIQAEDFFVINQLVGLSVNLEMTPDQKILDMALSKRPNYCCLVSEKKAVTTNQGGLNVYQNAKLLKPFVDQLKNHCIRVSLFVDPQALQIKAAFDMGADAVKIHTGYYANHPQDNAQYEKIVAAANTADNLGLVVHAGGGLNYQNVKRIAGIECIKELKIGHAIIARSIFLGLERAVSQMKALLQA